MTRPIKVLTGQVFGRWTVIGPPIREGKRTRYLCRCNCGREKIVIYALLVSGRSRSCGCLNAELVSLRFRGPNYKRKTYATAYGAYRSWKSMLSRCYRKGDRSYPWYGGKGITVCDAWKNDFWQFYRDMGDRPAGHTIDRKESSKNYTPDNCRWATRLEQGRESRTRVKHRISYQGRSATFREWSEITGISADIIRDRICYKKWPVERALTTPPKRALRAVLEPASVSKL